MCKFDVKLGRRKEVVAGINRVDVATITGPVLGRDPNRTLAIITCDVSTAADPTGIVLIRSGSATGPVVGSCITQSKTFVMTVEEFGQAVTQEIFVEQVYGANMRVSSSAARILFEIEDT